MEHPLHITNTLSRKKEQFIPINEPYVGMYVCGPTVYGEPHLGHARAYVTFDVFYRYLTYLGYKVRYVRNITDVGHLENDADEGEDKIAKKARLEQLEPMEVVQQNTLCFHDAMRELNNLPPSIEPCASGHIIEQIEIIKKIIDRGYAYEVDGSVYFDVPKYNQDHPYGILSGRVLDALIENTRELDGQDEKRNSVDFALWKKAKPEHIMRWPSPWSDGFPGWHLECTAMSTKYLGDTFDIHGGGMDLQFPHHEAEIAQSLGSCGQHPAKYWVHNNMITINGKKMGKSLGNFIMLSEFFVGSHELLDKPYGPMTIRFFILQAHYTSTADFSTEALTASEKGYKRLMEACKTLKNLEASAETTSGFDITEWKEKCFSALNDDLNTPILIAQLFDAVKFINSVAAGSATIQEADLKKLQILMNEFVFDILGLVMPGSGDNEEGIQDNLIHLLLKMRADARKNKNFAMSDQIRDDLMDMGVELKDGSEGTTYKIKG